MTAYIGFAALVTGSLSYAIMMFFSWIFVGKSRTRGLDAIFMIVFWPVWMVPEAKRSGDPLLTWGSIWTLGLLGVGTFIWMVR